MSLSYFNDQGTLTRIVFILTILAIFLHIAYFRNQDDTEPTRRGQRLRSTPNTLPLIHNGLVFLRPRHRLFAWFARITALHGAETLRIQVPFLPKGALVSNPACLKFIYSREDIFQKGSFFKSRSWDLFGDGIINNDGPAWLAQRRAGHRYFGRVKMRDLRDTMLPEVLDNIGAMLEGVAGAGEVVDLQEVFHDITTGIMGMMAYGREMHTGDEFAAAFEYASGRTAERFQNPLWRITELFTGAEMRRSIRIVKQFGRRLVARAQAEQETEKEESEQSLIDVLLKDCGLNQDVVADAALNFLSAGRDTVAQALTWTFYLLMKHPNAADRLSEGDAVYRKAVFYESLRLYPPIPFEIKQVQAETVLPDDTELSAGSIVVWCLWAMNRAPHIWGEGADVFDPKRWIDDKGAFAPRSQAEFPTFNGGKRLCLGIEMAETIANMVIGRFTDEVCFEPAFDIAVERVTGSSLTLPMEGGLPVHVKPKSMSRRRTSVLSWSDQR